MNAKLVGVLFLVMLLAIFVLQNAERVTVRLLFWDVSMSRVVLIVMTALAGFVCGFVVARISGRVSKRGNA